MTRVLPIAFSRYRVRPVSHYGASLLSEAAIPGFGWWAIDPTNDSLVGERHVTIGRGRDYEDVMPLRGIYHGDAEADLSVEVTMTQTVVSDRLPQMVIDQ